MTTTLGDIQNRARDVAGRLLRRYEEQGPPGLSAVLQCVKIYEL